MQHEMLSLKLNKNRKPGLSRALFVDAFAANSYSMISTQNVPCDEIACSFYTRRRLAMRILFKNGWIVDGTGGAPYQGDVLTEDDRIVSVGGSISADADKILDITDCQICPGICATKTRRLLMLP